MGNQLSNEGDGNQIGWRMNPGSAVIYRQIYLGSKTQAEINTLNPAKLQIGDEVTRLSPGPPEKLWWNGSGWVPFGCISGPEGEWWEPRKIGILPLGTTRAYYPHVEYSPTPIFFDGSSLRKYVCYSGNGTNLFVAFSDDGIFWDQEQMVLDPGAVAQPYQHPRGILIGSTLYLWVWHTSLIYSPAAMRLMTFDITATCVQAITDLPCANHPSPLYPNYITTVVGTLRRGTYGPGQSFYNSSPSASLNGLSPLSSNPYNYAFTMTHMGTAVNRDVCGRCWISDSFETQ